MGRFSADHILARLPAEVHRNPTLEEIRRYLERETRMQRSLFVLRFLVGGGILVYANLYPESHHGIVYMLAGASLLMASLSLHRLIDTRMSDEEIANRIQRHLQSPPPHD